MPADKICSGVSSRYKSSETSFNRPPPYSFTSVNVGECTRAGNSQPARDAFDELCLACAQIAAQRERPIRVAPRGPIFRRALPSPPDYAK